jgi:putative transposase
MLLKRELMSLPRMARERSKSGIYHIMMRGTNRQEIFHDDEDCIRFLETLNRYKKKSKIKVYGWCLMGNHTHLLIQEGEEDISTTIKRIGISYVWFYNSKYKTIGHLFQDRFKSEKVDNDEHLLTVIRYIHQNPVKAGIAKRAIEWKWSSCCGYYGKAYYPPGLLDVNLVLGILSSNRDKAIDEFIKHNELENNDACLDDVKKVRLTDSEASEEIKRIVKRYEITEIKSLPKEEKEVIFREVKKVEGLSLRQAARILGVSHVLIHNS